MQRPVGGPKAEDFEEDDRGRWVVRSVSGAAATKTDRCPGCDHEIAAGVAHVVAWNLEGPVVGGGAEDRRHWHRGCWQSRGRRSPRVRRSRGAPRY